MKIFLNSGMIDGKMNGIVLPAPIVHRIHNPDVLVEGVGGSDTPGRDDFLFMCRSVKEKNREIRYINGPVDDNFFNYWVAAR